MHLPRISRTLKYSVLALAVSPLPGQGEGDFLRDLTELTAPELAGRAVGTPGGELAIRYIAAEMEAAGLRPWVQGTFRQDFAVPRDRGTFAAGTAVWLHRGQRSAALEMGQDALPFRFSSDGRVRAPVVFAGYGLKIPELGHDDYAGLDVKGRLVLVLRGPLGKKRGSPYAAHWRELLFRKKLELAERAGAAGFLLCAPASQGAAGDPDDISPALLAQGEAGIPAVWITRSAAAKLGGGERGFLARERELLAGGVGALGPIPGVEVELNVRMGPGRPPLETANVVGWLSGSDPELAGEYVVVGAHHDHLGRGRFGSLGGPAAVGLIHPGADDNASGVAGLLELARTMASGPRPRRSVLFVAFGAKELGQRGSRHFLAHAPVAADRIVAMINLDMIGRARSCAVRVEEVGSGDGLRQLLEGLPTTPGLKVKVGRGTSPVSDHRVFLEAGIPALLFHTGLSEQYRRPADVPCLVEVEGALEVVRLVREVVSGLAEQRDRPRFVGSPRRR